MARKNKKKTVLKQSKHDIANFGVGGSKLAATGTSSSSFTGATIDWSKVDNGKKVMTDLMKNQENYRSTVQSKKNTKDLNTLRDKCIEEGGNWNPTTGTCEEGKGKEKKDIDKTGDKEVKCEDCNGKPVEPIDGKCPECEEKVVDEKVVDKKVVDEKVVDEKVVDDDDDFKDGDVGKGKNLNTNQANQNFNFSSSTGKEQKELNDSYPKNNVNPNVKGMKLVDSSKTNQLGGGNFKSMKIKSSFGRDGKQNGYTSKGKDSRGNKWDYGFKVKEDKNGLRTMEFNELDGRARQIFRDFGLSTKGTLSAQEWKTFRTKYKTLLKSAQAQLKKAQDNGLTETELFKAVGHKEKLVLQMNSRGFFNGDIGEDSPAQFRSPINYEAPVQFRSPFARRDTSNKNLRKNWKPQQSAPMNYNSPFHQEEAQDIQGQQFGSIWEKMEAYGADMPEKVDKFIQHTSYDPETDKPINSFQNQEWVKAITLWCQDQKSSMVKARNSKNNDEQQRIAAAVNTLIQDVTTYSGKFMDWMARNSGDQAEGNAGGSVVSEGSKKDERFIGNTTFMGDVNMVAAVGEDGKLGIKAYGLDEVKFVEELDNDVFAKDDVGFLQFTKVSEQLQKDAESGKPLNENVVKGNADGLLKNKDSILSWAFDPLYGQSWLQDFSEGNPNMNLDVFMPESPEFDIDYLTDELHGWLTSKLTESYNQNVPQQPEKKGDAAQGIMDETLAGVEEEKENKEGVYAEGGEEGQPQEEMMAQGPPPPTPPQESPMTYKGAKSKRALELIAKYSPRR